MGRKLQEIEGVYLGDKYRFGDCLIGEIALANGCEKQFGTKYITIKGDADDGELHRNGKYRFYGRAASYRNKRTGADDRQFHFDTFVVAQSHDRDGIIQYIAKAGEGLGVGSGIARKLWDAYGTDAVKQIRTSPETLCQFSSRITREQCRTIGEILETQKATEDATIELTGLLNGRGMPRTTARKAIKKWGNRAAQVIRRDPYSLMAFRGCGFKLCDALWLEFGLSPHRLRRQALCAWHSIASSNTGDTWYPVERVGLAVQQGIGGTEADPVRAIKLATRLGRVSPDHYGALAGVRTDGVHGPIVETGGRLWLAEGKHATAERDLADMIVNALAEANRDNFLAWPNASEIEGIDDHQRSKFVESLISRICVLGGSPGTGKTYATAMLIKHMLKAGIVGIGDVAIGCPTGKAAVRITEAMQAAGVPLVAKTWHSLLGVGMSDGESGNWSFQHNAKNPWPYRLLIGDEWSMMDTALMRSVFAARPRGCHVLIVGDINQLAPVGTGAPLRDLIASKIVGYGELTEIKRNSGGIVEACAAMRDGRQWTEGDNLVVDAAGDQMQAALLHCLAGVKNGLHPVWDFQVIVAVNARSPLSRKAVNEFLQHELNPNPLIPGTPFRIDDKVVCLKNGRYTAIEADDEAKDDEGGGNEVYVANGELGRVLAVEDKSIIAKLSNPGRTIRIPRGQSSQGDGEEAGTGCSWDLAYGLTCHKLQGSEVPVAIVLADEYPGARQVCDRSWIYTAISRAKKKCVIVGKASTVDAMCRRQHMNQRKTFLQELLQMKTTEKAMESI